MTAPSAAWDTVATFSRKRRFRSVLQFAAPSPVESAALRWLGRLPSAADRVPPAGGLPDSPEFWRMVAGHRLHGVAAATPGAGCGALPAWARTPSTTAVLAEAATARAVLAERGIRSATLKGAWIAGHYPDPAMRLMSDVDLLVSGAETAAATTALRAAGYRPVPGQELNGPSKRLHDPELVHPDRGVPVEVHHRVSRTLTIERLNQLTGSTARDELPVQAHLLHRLLDIAKDGWARAGALAYADVLLLRTLGADVVEVVGLARRAGVGAACASVLLACEDLLGPALTERERAVCATAETAPVRLARRRACADGALLRMRYSPRWQRRVVRRVLGRVN